MKKSNDKLKESFERNCKEFNSAWNEFFKNKTNPKNDKEDIEQQKEFAYWYNHIRKQTDTGRTPVEMGERIFNFVDGDEVDEIFGENFAIAEDIANACFESVWGGFEEKDKEKSTKRDIGFNLFLEGARMVLDIVRPTIRKGEDTKILTKINAMIALKDKRYADDIIKKASEFGVDLKINKNGLIIVPKKEKSDESKR